MNLSTIVISIGLLALLVLAVRYLVKNGSCATCNENGCCHAAPTECSGHCNCNQDHAITITPLIKP
ncbi:MAG TPA: hypothetical protein VN441_10460 [Syntrophomonas sp.]|nr:hypothetical protein [Syntrophomonas sp.]